MTPLDFAALCLGKRITLPGGEGQCVDLCNHWLDLALGLPRVYRNAVDWQQPIGGLAWTTNDPSNVPPAGAVVVWRPTPALKIGPYGHVAVCLCADVMHLLSIDQNFSTETASLQCHSYIGVAGWQA
jgi:hypothetical protein